MQGDTEPQDTPSWLAPQGPREGLSHYAEVIRDRWRLIVACVVVATVAAGVYTKLAPRSWQAESKLLLTPISGEAGVAGLGLITNSSDPTTNITTATSFVKTPEVGELVARSIGGASAGALLGQVSAVPLGQSNVISITATASSPARAQVIANTFAIATVENRTAELHRRLEKIIPTMRAQLQTLPLAQRTGPGSLGERLAYLQTLLAGSDPTISVDTLASLPTSPSSPRTKLSIAAGLIAGLVLGLGLAFTLEALDTRVRREETLRRIFRLPVLARIPRERSRSLTRRDLPLKPWDLSLPVQESYRMLRVALGASRRRATTRSVMITGSASSEGKSSVALNLAATLAASGQQIILIETDLRRPSLAATLGVNPDRDLADVLLEDILLEDALFTVDLLGENLKLLLANPTGLHTADGLLASADKLVEQASALADYVVFDAPPVTEVSDVLPLSQHVDEVVIVARLGHSRTNQLVNLGEVLSRQGVRPVGLVIVEDTINSQAGYYYAESPSFRQKLGKPRRDELAADASAEGSA
jgi:Mrp family chromosome partitioning ATPase/capsular polysaccharide biosynthesis protein